MKVSVSETPGVWGALKRFWQRSYAADYVGFTLLVAAYVMVSNSQRCHGFVHD